ncbi:MAG: DUF3189 family protein [Thermanaeromonas sp.]|uniref:DUF3189 family protein n=1 Tax=Thermanaeromonas sp. TaxID=2003697 RepID=UPI00243A7507|nr:DUF3189 family protein [Thermanaeromonas sp.]MCG0278016.1 DUF3189 family protein [Thermanaeromonas sp.]
MKIIYHCFGGTHSSVIAAALHLGWLPRSRLPRADEIKAIPYFDRRRKSEEGHIQFMGRDTAGNEIYAVGKRGMGKLLENFVYDLTCALGLPREELLLVDTTPLVNSLMALGGFLSRRLGLTFLGRPLVVCGVRKAYPGLVRLVENLRPRVMSLPVETASLGNGSSPKSSLSPEKNLRLLIFTSSRNAGAALAAAGFYLRSRGCLSEGFGGEKGTDAFEPGRLIFVGRDPGGTKVYATVIGPYFQLLCRIVKDFLNLWGIEQDAVRLLPARKEGYLDALSKISDNGNEKLKKGESPARKK